MKKISFIIFLLILISSSFIFAEDSYNKEEYIVDNENILSSNEINDLKEMTLEFREKHKANLYIIVRSNLYDGKTSRETAEIIYGNNNFGYGDTKDGVLLMLAMADRDYAIVTKGSAINALTDYGLNQIEEGFLGYLSDDKFYKGFSEFIALNDEFFTEYEKGKAYDVNHTYRSKKSRMKAEAAIVVISLVIAIFVPFTFTLSMKTAKRETYAMDYVKDGSFNLHKKYDRYLYSHVSRTKIQKSDSSGSSGGGSTVSSSGYGGSSGKF